MPADPFLLAHQVDRGVFDMGGKLYPVSVRDQMVRGQSIIDRVLDAGFAAKNQLLLVIGAGAGGAVAAMKAAASGVETHLIDAQPSPPAPFGRQRDCQTRWIDPHEYEWPSGHWPFPSYPYDAPPLHPYYGRPAPLPWTAQWADDLAFAWDALFARALKLPTLRFHPGTTLAPFPVGPPTFIESKGLWKVPLSNGMMLNVGMILNAVGFGAERCEVPTSVPGGPPPAYRGLAFWETDKFRRPNCGLKAPRVAHVVVSGGGDGALQDFLRIMTGRRSVRRLYLEIAAALPAGSRWMLRRVERRIAAAENRAARSFLWGTGGADDHDIHRVLHNAHRDAVIWVLQQSAVVGALAKVLPPAPPDVHLIHSCIHFTQVYPFNRFLTLLVDGYYASRPRGASRLIPGAQVVGVTGAGRHACNVALPRRCLGRWHAVTLAASAHANCQPPAPPPLAGLRANVVIIRHGVTGAGPAPGPLPSLETTGRLRHVLPIHCSR